MMNTRPPKKPRTEGLHVEGPRTGKTLDLSSVMVGGGGDPDDEAPLSLEDAGYQFVRGPTGTPSDFVLRSIDDPTKPFKWKGQKDYDVVGAFVSDWIADEGLAMFGLESTFGGAIFSTPGACFEQGPVLLLIHGSPPGGSPGVWGRSLCINGTTHTGAMFDYILRAKEHGWGVIITNHNSRKKPIFPHEHIHKIFQAMASQKVLIVAHSYGGSLATGLVKMLAPAERQRIVGVALTDGMTWVPDTNDQTQERIIDERVPDGDELDMCAQEDAYCMVLEIMQKNDFEKLDSDAMKDLHQQVYERCREGLSRRKRRLERLAKRTPGAFSTADGATRGFYTEVTVNFVASKKPIGKMVRTPKQPGEATLVSSGHPNHPATTHAATEGVFRFLTERLGGKPTNDIVEEFRTAWSRNRAVKKQNRAVKKPGS